MNITVHGGCRQPSLTDECGLKYQDSRGYKTSNNYFLKLTFPISNSPKSLPCVIPSQRLYISQADRAEDPSAAVAIYLYEVRSPKIEVDFLG